MLKHSSQTAWACEAFLKTDDLDAFLEQHLQNEWEHFVELNREGKDFYGQEITDDIMRKYGLS